MTNVTLAVLGLSGGELVIILFVLLTMVTVFGGAIILVALLAFRNKKSPPISSQPPTQVIRQCPGCGTTLTADAPEGLCPACLLNRGFATEGGAQPGQTPFVPPTVAELAKGFPQLEILELIGKGGMGAVYKARQPALERLVALKILPSRSGNDPGFAERFSREARALAKLSHPNIVGVYDYGVVGQASSLSQSEEAGGKSETGRMPVLHYFIMEFVDGPNLRQIEQAGKLSPREALEIIPQICVALQFAHDEGIVHRDIKPENVLLDKKGRVKIADFGLAKILGQEPNALRLTGARDVMGTPHYMAPEQVEKPQQVDHRADIYSLGVVFYEMLTGELPLGKFQPPSQKVQVDVRLDEVVLRSLAKEPERRYQQVSEVKTRVETIAATPEPGRSRGEEAPFSKSEIRNPKSETDQRLLTSSPTNKESRLSSPAVIGACWAPFCFFVVFALFFFWRASSATAPGSPVPGPSRLEFLPILVLLALGLTAPFGTTILGWIAVSQIRRSAGQLYGLGLAVFDGLLFPLLALDALIFGLLYLFGSFGTHLIWPASSGDGSFGGGLAVGYQISLCLAIWIGSATIISAIVDFAIVRRVWQAVNRPLEGVPVASLTPSQSSGRAWKIAAIILVGVLLLLAVPVGTWLLSYDPNRQPSERPTPVLETTPAWIKSDYIGHTYFPGGDSIEITSVERTEDRMTVKGRYNLVSHDNATLALYITSTNLTNFPEDPRETMHISKGRGDFELSRSHLVPGLPHVNMYPTNGGGPFAELYFGTKGEAEEESKLNLHGSSLSFGPVIERELGLGGSDGPTHWLDLDAGEIVERPAGWWITSQMTGEKNRLPAFGVYLDGDRLNATAIGMVFLETASRERWDIATAADVREKVEQLVSEHKIKSRSPGSDMMMMVSKTNDWPQTYVFQTPKRTTGLLQITGFTANPRGVNIRYKLVQSNVPTNTSSASAEIWSPALAPGEKPDLQKIRDEVKDLMSRHQYDEALQREIWYFNHALEFGESDPIRLSFGLNDWIELSRRYPKAREAMTELRDRDTGKFSEGRGYAELFDEIVHLNEGLRQEDASVALFKAIQEKDPALAGQCYFYIRDLLLKKGEYQLCLKGLGDPQKQFDSIRGAFNVVHDKEYFVRETLKLIEILVCAGDKAGAGKIQGQAVVALDDSRLKSAVSDTERKIGK
jgi:serine/threonine protein kinase